MLRDLGAVRLHAVGASRVVSLNPRSPLVPELRRLVSLRLSSHRAAARGFSDLAADVDAVREVLLLGSAARGAAGPGSDVDVAVILDPRSKAASERVYRAAAEAQDETVLRLNPILLSARERKADTPLSRALHTGEVLFDRLG